MRIKKRTRNLTEPEKLQFEEYLRTKMKRLQKSIRTPHEDGDTWKLDVRLEKHNKHTAFEFEYVLSGPHDAHFATKEVKHTITEAMDNSTDRLATMLKKYFEKLIAK